MIAARFTLLRAAYIARTITLAIAIAGSAPSVRAEHGRFDRTTPDPREKR